MVSGSHPVESIESCLDGSSQGSSEYRRREATGPLSCWIKSSPGVFNPPVLCPDQINRAGPFVSSAFPYGAASGFTHLLGF